MHKLLQLCLFAVHWLKTEAIRIPLLRRFLSQQPAPWTVLALNPTTPISNGTLLVPNSPAVDYCMFHVLSGAFSHPKRRSFLACRCPFGFQSFPNPFPPDPALFFFCFNFAARGEAFSASSFLRSWASATAK